MDVAILCGGRGMRLQEQTRSIPKPLVEIGGRPILWHVIQIYAVQGFRRFLLLTGYLGDQVAAFVDAVDWPAGVEIECIDTGAETPTGARILRAAERLSGGAFCATYADGVADLDLARLRAQHTEHGALATMTVVRPPLQFGVAVMNGDDAVTGFREKPRSEHWVNGGFFCFEPGVLDYLDEEATLEREPLERLAGAGELRAYRHTGFWECLDTHKDALELNDLWATGEAPWKLWR
jgi:glucose-1-phosphate cytidylyltransferase